MADQAGEDIDERWTLRASDRVLLGNKTGTTRLGFAVLLKMFQAEGRFPSRPEEVPVAAVEAIARQIGVPAAAWRSYDWGSRAIAYHRAQIRDALGFREATLDDAETLSFYRIIVARTDEDDARAARLGERRTNPERVRRKAGADRSRQRIEPPDVQARTIARHRRELASSYAAIPHCAR